MSSMRDDVAHCIMSSVPVVEPITASRTVRPRRSLATAHALLAVGNSPLPSGSLQKIIMPMRVRIIPHRALATASVPGCSTSAACKMRAICFASSSQSPESVAGARPSALGSDRRAARACC